MERGPNGTTSAIGTARGTSSTAIEVARHGEPDRYVAALFAPYRKQAALISLAAFVADVRRIPATVSDPMIGEIKLQWWRDALADGQQKKTSGHPIADTFADVIHNHSLPLPELHRFIDACGFGMIGDLHADARALEAHLAAVEGVPFSLAWQILTDAPLAAETARLCGECYGLARDLGRLPALIYNGGFPIPATELDAHGIPPGELIARIKTPGLESRLAGAAAALERRACAVLASARRELASASPQGLAAVLPLAMVEPYLSAQNRSSFRRFEQIMTVLPVCRFWHMGRARLISRI